MLQRVQEVVWIGREHGVDGDDSHVVVLIVQIVFIFVLSLSLNISDTDYPFLSSEHKDCVATPS